MAQLFEYLKRFGSGRVDVGHFVHIQPIAQIGGHASGGGMGLIDQTFPFQTGHVVADRGGTHGKFIAHNDRLRTDWLAAVDEMLNDGF